MGQVRCPDCRSVRAGDCCVPRCWAQERPSRSQRDRASCARANGPTVAVVAAGAGSRSAGARVRGTAGSLSGTRPTCRADWRTRSTPGKTRPRAGGKPDMWSGAINAARSLASGGPSGPCAAGGCRRQRRAPLHGNRGALTDSPVPARNACCRTLLCGLDSLPTPPSSVRAGLWPSWRPRPCGGGGGHSGAPAFGVGTSYERLAAAPALSAGQRRDRHTVVD